MSDLEQKQEIPEEKQSDSSVEEKQEPSADKKEEPTDIEEDKIVEEINQDILEEGDKESPLTEELAGKSSVLSLPLFPKTSRWKKWGADSIKFGLALLVLILGLAIWFQPPLVTATKPYVTYTFQGRVFDDATLYRPLAIPTRFYVKLPHELARRYQWFSIDLRREVVALAEEPKRRFLSAYAVRRGDPLGLDLEFTKIDGLEWNVNFFRESIVFSNTILRVQLDTKKPEGRP